MYRFLYLFVALTAVSNADFLPDDKECGVSPQNRLLIGISTNLDDYPWTARLLYQSDDEVKFFCQGVLINKRYVLTQAHCLDKIPSKWTLKSVRLGEYNVTSEQDCVVLPGEKTDCADAHIDVGIEEKIIHEDHVSDKVVPSNDIALLRLEKDVTFTDFIRPICLPKSQTDKTKEYGGKQLLVTGWGKSYVDDKTVTKTQFDLVGISRDDCNKEFKGKIIIGEGLLCASAKNSFCAGSSGNPLMVNNYNDERWMLVGTESFGPTCRTSDQYRLPTVYTDVGFYSDWIVSKLKA